MRKEIAAFAAGGVDREHGMTPGLSRSYEIVGSCLGGGMDSHIGGRCPGFH